MIPSNLIADILVDWTNSFSNFIFRVSYKYLNSTDKLYDMLTIYILLIFVAATHLIAEYIGTKREIGYAQSVFWSIMLSPFIGLIITLCSKKVKTA